VQLFTASKQAAYVNSSFGHSAYLYFEGSNRSEQSTMVGDDPFPFGIARNRRMLEMLFYNSHAEGLTQKLATVEEVFFPSVLDT
jgi:4,5-dihydroxyphthalate decarboxylase